MEFSEQLPPDLVEFESVERRTSSTAISFKNNKVDGDLPSLSNVDNTYSDDASQPSSAETSVMLAASLQALATHCAHLQFRLQQVLAAPVVHRDKLLNELAEFASRPIDHIGGINTGAVPPLIEGLDSPSDSGNQSTLSNSAVPSRMLNHLKTQVADLERFVSYIQKNEPSTTASVSESTPFLTQDSKHSTESSRRNSEIHNFSNRNDDDFDESSDIPLHRRLWQVLACGRSMQRVRTTDSDGSDVSDDEDAKSVVRRQPAARTLSDTCDEDNENVIVLFDTTVRAYVAASELEVSSRMDALAYSLAVVITHGIRKERLYRHMKQSGVGARDVRHHCLPVAACCWTFLKYLYDSQGGPPSKESSAARLRATFDVPEPTESHSKSDMVTLLLGAINRVIVEEEEDGLHSPRTKSGSVSGYAGDSAVSIAINCWSRFVRIGLIRPSPVHHETMSFPLVVWLRALTCCCRFLKNTHYSWAPLRASPEQVVQAVTVLDDSLDQLPTNDTRYRLRSVATKGRKKLSKTTSGASGRSSRPSWGDDVIIPSV